MQTSVCTPCRLWDVFETPKCFPHDPRDLVTSPGPCEHQLKSIVIDRRRFLESPEEPCHERGRARGENRGQQNPSRNVGNTHSPLDATPPSPFTTTGRMTSARSRTAARRRPNSATCASSCTTTLPRAAGTVNRWRGTRRGRCGPGHALAAGPALRTPALRPGAAMGAGSRPDPAALRAGGQ